MSTSIVKQALEVIEATEVDIEVQHLEDEIDESVVEVCACGECELCEANLLGFFFYLEDNGQDCE